MKTTVNQLVAIFAEGATEVEFYKAVVTNARKRMGAPLCVKIESKDMKGIGNFKSNVLRQFRNLKKTYPDDSIQVFLCIDRDAFELQKKPPIDKAAVKKALEQAGAQKVVYVEARQSIEDWFLCDFEGVLSYLGLPANTKRPGGTGQEALRRLFFRAGKVYVKGGKTDHLIEYLDIFRIMDSCCAQLKPLCNSLGLSCKKVCGK